MHDVICLQHCNNANNMCIILWYQSYYDTTLSYRKQQMINTPKTSCDIHDINQNILSIKSFLTSLYLVVLLMHSSYVLCSQNMQNSKTEVQKTKKQLQIASNDTSIFH